MQNRVFTESGDFVIPKQGIIDYLTRADELLIENLNLLRSLQSVVNVYLPESRRIAPVEMKKRLESGDLVPYQIKTFDLTAARDKEPVVVEGDHMAAHTDGTLEGVTVRFNMETADPVPIQFFNPWRQQFFSMFLTHTAQPGKTLYLAIGRNISSDTDVFTLSAELVNKVSGVADSTIAALGIAGTYTGSAFSCEQYGRIIGSVYSDQAGTLYVDQRNDGTNWDVRSTIAYAAATLIGFTVEVVGNEARIVYTNGAVAQTTFRLYARMRRV